MNEPRFSIVMIAKNEANTLPRLAESLNDFRSRNGEVILLDTGSTDGTAELGRSYGFSVTEVGEKFIKIIDADLAFKINDRFVVTGEKDIVEAGNRLFDFAAARNYATSLAKNDFIVTLDADEAYSTFNIDELDRLIGEGYEQFEYQFVYAHDAYGNAAVQFVQSKAFDRRKVSWSGVVHEVLGGDNAKRILLAENIIKLEHWQEQGKEHRGNYLVGLALDCFENPDKDRQSHYLAREMVWTGRPKSAIKEFKRHITMNGWPAERAQSMIFIGDAYGIVGQEDEQIAWYSKAYDLDPNRREALIKLASFYKRKNNPRATNTYATAATTIPWSDYYANDKSHYEQLPHELLYWAKGWLGDVPGAQKEIMECFKYQRENPQYIHDSKYYFEYPANSIVGWMSFEEQTFLYDRAKEMQTVVELGSWKGKSTHAICSSGCPSVTAIDTWAGSAFEPEAHAEARSGSVLEMFKNNTKEFTNLKMIQMDINEAVSQFEDKSIDMVFIDAGHTYEEVKNDIEKWLPKARVLLCGHDHTPAWSGVIQAVQELLGGPDEIHDTIWVKWLNK